MSRYAEPDSDAMGALTAYLRQAPEGSRERMLLAYAFLADKADVRETNGPNRGPWVDLFVSGVQLDPKDRNPWCAAACSFAAKMAGCWSAKSPLVADWLRQAHLAGRFRNAPKRGYVCVKDYGHGKGHIGIVVGSALGFVRSIEGNTGPGEAGSQRDGDGLYRRVRRASWWTAFIDCDLGAGS